MNAAFWILPWRKPVTIEKNLEIRAEMSWFSARNGSATTYGSISPNDRYVVVMPD